MNSTNIYMPFFSYHFYYRQKEARSKIVEAGINSGEIIDVFSENRNMARNVIDSVNLWLENSLLFQDRLTDAYDKEAFELNQEYSDLSGNVPMGNLCL